MVSDENAVVVPRSAVESAPRRVLDAGGAPDPCFGDRPGDGRLHRVRVAAVRREPADLADREPGGGVAAARVHLGAAFGRSGNGLTAEGGAGLTAARSVLTRSDDVDPAHQWSL
ncbi:hypothetical protein [Umezawaea sp.]|uniref:hypothetical protein n=1 Tax=Umezawaea sp. TaxID=1955258 RepID=UPI002ED03D84